MLINFNIWLSFWRLSSIIFSLSPTLPSVILLCAWDSNDKLTSKTAEGECQILTSFGNKNWYKFNQVKYRKRNNKADYCTVLVKLKNILTTWETTLQLSRHFLANYCFHIVIGTRIDKRVHWVCVNFQTQPESRSTPYNIPMPAILKSTFF